MLSDALIVVVYIALIVFIIMLTILCIKLMGTLNKVDYLLDNVTKKAESLDGVFDLIDNTTSKLNTIGESIISALSSFVSKIMKRKRKNIKEEDIYE